MGFTSGAGTVYHYGAPEFTPGFFLTSISQILFSKYLVTFLLLIPVKFCFEYPGKYSKL
jgi:hypothetical protein